jgi:RimJ/RimL family protein N-acetyltransferase
MEMFRTERLVLRKFAKDDIDDLFLLLSDPAVMEFCSGPLDMEGAKKWLNTAMEYYKKYGYDFWAVRRRITGEFLGQMGIFRQEISGRDENCLAFMLGKKHWNMGYASEGAAACIDYAFRTLSLDKLTATVEPENFRSICVLDKIGMEKTGKTEFLNKDLYIYEINRKDKQSSLY